LNVCKIKTLLYNTLTSVRQDHRSNNTNPASPTRKSKDSNTEPETIEEVLDNLKKGYIMLKHSPKTPDPHSKFVKISRKGYKGGLHTKEELQRICSSLLIIST
jgi:hypothetical protein